MEPGVYRTDDLALATILTLAGYKYRLVRITDRKCVWDFSCVDDRQEDFEDIVGDFWEFKYRVEPRAFTTRWAEMRKELFALIPRHHPVHPSTSAA